MHRWPALLTVLWVAWCGSARAAGDAAGRAAAVTPVAVNASQTRTVWMAMHERYKTRAAAGDIDLLFLGNSIVWGWEREGIEVWRRHYGGRRAAAFGIPGDATQHVLWRVLNGELDGLAPRLLVLLIGTNNNWASGQPDTPQDIADGVAAVAAAIRERLPDTRILVQAILPRETETSAAHRNNRAANALLPAVADGNRILFRDLNASFMDADGRLDPEAFAPDLVHLSEIGYERWATALEAEVAAILEATP